MMTPEDLRRLYEQETQQPWDDEAGSLWLRKNFVHLNTAIKLPRLEFTAHIHLNSKASTIAQEYCNICKQSFPIRTIPIRIQPESWQVKKPLDKMAFKRAMLRRFQSDGTNVMVHGRVCLKMVFVCSRSRRMRDLDNMAKLTMDALIGVLIEDDRYVDHLNLIRIEHDGDEEYLTINISASNLHRHEDVVVPTIRVDWAGAETLRLEDFREE